MKNRNKKIFAGSMAAVLLLGASSLAWFTDRTEGSIAGQAGNLCLEMTDIEANLDNLAPGDERDISFKYKNLGSLAMDTRVTYALSYELDEEVANVIKNDLDVIATLAVDEDELVLTADDDVITGTFETGTIKGTKEDVGLDKLAHTLNFNFDESVGNIGQKMKFKLDILVEGKQNRNNPTWEQVHKTTIKFGDQNMEVVPASKCNANDDEAEDSQENSQYAHLFKFEENDSGYTVIGFNSEAVESELEENSENKDDVAKFVRNPIIPKVYNGKPVTSIGSSAFASDRLTSVVIPDSVTEIGFGAFKNNELTSVVIPDSVTSIGVEAFKDNQLTSVVIPNSVTEIRWGAFDNNKLTSVDIPDSVITIGNSAFAYNQLTSVDIPDSVTQIDDYAFNGNQLTSVVIPDSVTEIGDSAFSGNQLTSVVIPDSVTTIGSWAFANNELTSVVIPDSVTKIGFWAFNGNPGGVVYANEIGEDSWETLRGYRFETTWELKPLSEYKK